jgi:copper chaperone CopZ
MKYLLSLFMTIFLFSLSNAQTKISNPTIDSVTVYGNCGMCKKTIEKAANKTGVVSASWDTETNMLTVTFDNKKTSLDEILQKIAAVGYDSDKYRAKDEVYSNLHGCCQYDRPKKD